MISVAFSGLLCFFQSQCQPEHTAQQHDQRRDNTEHRRCESIRTEVSHRNRVLNLRRTRNRSHREGERAERDSRRKQPFRNISFSEQRRADRIDGEGRYKERNTAVSDDRARKHNSPEFLASSRLRDNRFRDRFRAARKVHHLAEYRAEQEYREIGLYIRCQIRHICFCIDGHHVEVSTLKDYKYGRDQRQYRRDQDNRPALIGQHDK